MWACLLGDEWHQTVQWQSAALASEDVLWARERLFHTFDLYEDIRFRLAFDAAGTTPFITDQRSAIAHIWSGIESIFGVQQELSYRIGLYLAVLLEDDTDRRVTVQNDSKRLYGKRSKAVHGAAITEAELREAAQASWWLLARAVVSLTNLKEPIPDARRLDEALLGRALSRLDDK